MMVCYVRGTGWVSGLQGEVIKMFNHWTFLYVAHHSKMSILTSFSVTLRLEILLDSKQKQLRTTGSSPDLHL